jgi:hypothetical protein
MKQLEQALFLDGYIYNFLAVKISATCTQADNSEFVVFTLEILIGAW